MKLTKKKRLMAQYVTVALAIGVEWAEARRIAREIVYGK